MEKVNPGDLMTVSGLISGVPRDQLQSVDILPSPNSSNIHEKSRCVDSSSTRCRLPYVEYVIPACAETTDKILSFQGTLMDLSGNKYSNSTTVSLSCASAQPNNPPQANNGSYTTELGSNVTIDLKQITKDIDNDTPNCKYNKPTILRCGQ